ncbi:MAG: hypothetical protein HC802_13535 [Caldilineaceae bacterium]|nr:hypothetical protein [Caldilineaceae bacterium]
MVAYIYAPYFLTNIYVRGAIAEAGAMALLPWIFWSFRRLITRPQPALYVVTAALSLGGLAATHNITLLFTPPALLLYIAAVWWQERRRGVATARSLGWVAAGGLAAMGVGAFFWLPLIGERGYLSEIAYTVSTTLVPRHVWTLTNFLNTFWPFVYSDATPFQLGWVQLLAALVGFVLIRRRDLEWAYLGLLLLFGGLAISTLAQPLWLGNEILLIAQFPWRLLSVITLPMALFAGGSIVWLRPGGWQLGGAALLIGLLILGQRPPSHLPDITPVAEIDMRLANIAQFEADTGAFGASSSREFLPRWAEDFVMTPDPDPLALSYPVEVELLAANPLAFSAIVSSTAPTELRLSDYYFPGWQLTLDETQTLDSYPSTVQALLTTQIPAGVHTLDVAWVGTRLQRWAGYLSLLTLLLLLLLIVWFRRRDRYGWLLATMLLALLLFGAVASFKPAPALISSLSGQPLEVRTGLQLSGLTTRMDGPNMLNLFPRWFVQRTPGDLVAQWQLRDAQGTVAGEVTTFPYFGTLRSASWSAGTLVDDAYEMALAPGLGGGGYSLFMRFLPADSPDSSDLDTAWIEVGAITIPATSMQQPTPDQSSPVTFGDGEIVLDGYSMAINGDAVLGDGLPVSRVGDTVEYTLYWRSLKPITENYHGFVHLVDEAGTSLVQRDQLPGPVLSPPMLWNRFYPQPDIYRLQIPEDAESGLYWPLVGLYRFENQARLPAFSDDGSALGEGVQLPSLKVLGDEKRGPEHRVDARFEGVANLTGYDLETPSEVKPATGLR